MEKPRIRVKAGRHPIEDRVQNWNSPEAVNEKKSGNIPAFFIKRFGNVGLILYTTVPGMEILTTLKRSKNPVTVSLITHDQMHELVARAVCVRRVPYAKQ